MPCPGWSLAQYATAPGAPANAIRLAANENPQGPGPAARAAIQAAIGDCWKYPMGEEMTLKKQIAEREGLTPQHVMIGDGSSEILHIAAHPVRPRSRRADHGGTHVHTGGGPCQGDWRQR